MAHYNCSASCRFDLNPGRQPTLSMQGIASGLAAPSLLRTRGCSASHLSQFAGILAGTPS